MMDICVAYVQYDNYVRVYVSTAHGRAFFSTWRRVPTRAAALASYREGGWCKSSYGVPGCAIEL